jgi:hypothetical protein
MLVDRIKLRIERFLLLSENPGDQFVQSAVDSTSGLLSAHLHLWSVNHRG